ncbi:MAG: GGDEF domain-containing protein [Acidobacteria bacterium]|nr:GGDEF domain-containing protein [Acidobacteriota bacterium]
MAKGPSRPRKPGPRTPPEGPTLDLGPVQDEWSEGSTLVRSKQDLEAPRPSAEWALVVYAGQALGRVFPVVPGENFIGRSPKAQVALLDEEVSRLHATLVLEDRGGPEPRLQIQDLGSTNGTFVNGVQVEGTLTLHAGDRLTLGGHVLKLVAMDPLERAFHQALLDQSTLDPLTGLANRGATLRELGTRFDLSRRHDRPLCVVMVDMDHFKKINDTLGHSAGDFVLQSFGERVRANLRTSDHAGRIGGEEFLAILSETDREGAQMFAERLRRAVADQPHPLPTGPLEVTCSLGVAQRARSDADPGVLLARADHALYRAKRGGRNLVVLG